MSEFKMPTVGTPEHDALKARWSDKPVTFGQCNRLKSLFKQVSEAGGYAGKVPAKTAKAWDVLTTRDDDRRWVNLRSDKLASKMTMWQAHELGEQIAALISDDSPEVTVTKTAPVKPSPKATPAVTPVTFHDGDLIIVAGETRRISVNGKRAYLAKI